MYVVGGQEKGEVISKTGVKQAIAGRRFERGKEARALEARWAEACSRAESAL